MRTAILLFLSLSALGQNLNGFDLSDAAIPSTAIFPGGPPKDGIPSIDNPIFYPADNVGTDSLRILGVFYNGVAKAYPVNILNYHEVVNDMFEELPVVVTYCPLCGSGVSFSRYVEGQLLTFGVSGLLYNSDVLLYDRETGSLWSQLMQECISGPLKGGKLTMINTVNTTLKQWKRQHESTVVLSEETGHSRDYTQTPYAGYEDTQNIYFPVTNMSDRFDPKELVIGIEVDGHFKCYPFSRLKEKQVINDSFRKHHFEVLYSEDSRTAQVLEGGEPYPSIVAYWFAWYAFHPSTKVY